LSTLFTVLHSIKDLPARVGIKTGVLIFSAKTTRQNLKGEPTPSKCVLVKSRGRKEKKRKEKE
jgi:hypothetical protein